jgi:hypothetical protein
MTAATITLGGIILGYQKVEMNTIVRGKTEQTVIVSTTINASFMQLNLFPSSVTDLLAVSRESILSLLDTRDFLGYQLAHANGRIGDDDFREIAAGYLAKIHPADPASLASKVKTLVSIVGSRADTDTVSTVFNCEVDDAERALNEVAMQIGGSSSPMLAP